MPVLSYVQVAMYAYQAGVTDPEALTIATAITEPESRRNTHAHNSDASTGDNSYGLWQINMLGGLGPQRRRQFNIAANEQLFDPAINAKAMFIVSGGGKNWRPWTTYKNNKHLPYMDEARAAAAEVLGNPPSLLGPVVTDLWKPGMPMPTVPTELPPGLGESYVHRDLYLAGETLEASLADAVIDARISWSFDVPYVELTVRDPRRNLLRSPILTEKSVLHVDGIPFQLTSVRKRGPELVLTFDHVAVTIQRDNTVVVSVAPGIMTRSEFIGYLVQEESFLQYVPAPLPGQPVQVEMSRGEVDPLRRLQGDDDPEDTWDATGRLADEVRWRRWVLGWNEIHYAPDDWLMLLGPQAVLREGVDGVDEIDFEYDVAKKIATATVRLRPGKLSVYPGMCVQCAGVGAADGNWLVEGYTRSLFRRDAEVRLIQPRPQLAEPAHEPESTERKGEGGFANTDAELGSIFGLEGVAGSGAPLGDERGRQMVAWAIGEIGKPYRLGGNGPEVYDCSGFVIAAARSVGASGYPRNSLDMFRAFRAQGLEISIDEARRTPGALLFRTTPNASGFTHVAISLGYSTHYGKETVEAMGVEYGVTYGRIGSRFDSATLAPGVHRSQAATGSPGIRYI